MPDPKIYLIAHNIRSALNVGSLLRTSEGLGIDLVYLTGYTPYPAGQDKKRLPHIEAKVAKRIDKTALGAQDSIRWEHRENIFELLEQLSGEGFELIALEQTDAARPLQLLKPSQKMAIIVGREVEGIEPEVLAMTPTHIQIPMAGKKESFNVASAAAMALYLIKLKSDGQIRLNDDKI
jgi:23S rRNA (guanosine2251-2'-O)-methyltransferase